MLIVELFSCVYSFLPRASVDLTPETFRSLVLSGRDHWVLDFYAPWCGPCQHFAPEFEVLAQVWKLCFSAWILLLFFCSDWWDKPKVNFSNRLWDEAQIKSFLKVWFSCSQESCSHAFCVCAIDRCLKARSGQGRLTVRLIIRPVS